MIRYGDPKSPVDGVGVVRRFIDNTFLSFLLLQLLAYDFGTFWKGEMESGHTWAA